MYLKKELVQGAKFTVARSPLATKYFSLAIGIWPVLSLPSNCSLRMAAKLSDLATGFRPEISCPELVPLLVEKFLSFYVVQKFIAVLKSPSFTLTLSLLNPVHVIQSHLFSIHFNIILSRLGSTS
jgi:hypothetical protein